MSPRVIVYLRDIFWLALTSFGGPQAHLAVMHQVLVRRRRYFSEEELMESQALCQLLPGPSSTQMLIVLSQKRWNTLVALLALLVWILPATVFMLLLALLFARWQMRAVATDFLLLIQPMAIGIIAHSGYQLALRFVRNNTAMMLMLLSLLIAATFPTPWTFPLIILGAACVTNLTSTATPEASPPAAINWRSSYVSLLILLAVFAVIGLLALFTKARYLVLFENFFRFGMLTFGGGSVLVPQMFEQFVQHRNYLDAGDFLSGLAISQALPGPTFSFATFAGGMIMKDDGLPAMVAGGLLATMGIFLPGTLIAFLVYPIWQLVKHSAVARRSLEGINAAAAGLILSAALVLYTSMEFRTVNIFVVVATFLLLQYSRLHVSLLVTLALLSGYVYSRL
ncbi:MAG: chromate efflux transporter [Chitinophagales bacterium]|nr:chromate efflux transporter [Chitinophagales bacterium]MDW8393877.1 chromate efflux transporter [Chitinophagales bacterium]